MIKYFAKMAAAKREIGTGFRGEFLKSDEAGTQAMARFDDKSAHAIGAIVACA